MSDPLEGSLLGRYRLDRRLGAGGMGVVYRAWDVELERPVAIKLLADDLLGEPIHARRFLREARAAAALSHPNLCTVHEVGETDERPYLVMELLEGDSLASILRRRSPESQEIVAWALDFARGLAEAHERGLVHRDVKPGNLFVTRRGSGKVVDFGLARRFEAETGPMGAESPTWRMEERLTATGITLGTVPYMAPEQLLGQSVDPRSDVFSFGVVLYEMVSGQQPFDGPNAVASMNAILNQEPPPLSGPDPELLRQLQPVVTRALSKDPAARYSSMSELAAELERLKMPATASAPALDGDADGLSPTRSLVASAAPEGPVSRSRRPTVLALVALLVLTVLVTLVLASREVGEESAPAAREISSLAVLPLANLSGDPGQEYFADGMTEALITELSRIDTLRVISRQSVARFKDSQLPPREIASLLGVGGVIEGSAAREGDLARITVTLVDGSTDRQLWSRSYERNLESILKLQGEVARDIADNIAVVVTPEERRRLESAPDIDPEAHEAYLKARFLWSERSEEALRKAIEWFDEAARLEPDHAMTYVGLAETWQLLGEQSWEDGRIALARVELNAARAMHLAPELGEPHAALGLALHTLGWQWERAGAELQRAVELSPGYATAHQWYAEHLNAMARFEEAEREILRARELDPLSRIIGTVSGWIALCSGRTDLAITRFVEVLELDPRFFWARFYLAHARAENGDFDSALALLEALAEEQPDDSSVLGTLGNLAARAGKEERARELLATKSDSLSPYHRAMITAGLGDVASTCQALDRATEERQGQLASLRVVPWFAAIRREPCFGEILARMQLPKPAEIPD